MPDRPDRRRARRGRGLPAGADRAGRCWATIGLSDEPPPPGALRDKWDSLVAIVTVAEELADADPAATLATLAAELDQRAEAQHAPTVEGVTLASLHAAKGLEWDAVFLVGLTDGTMPIQHAETPEEIEEERRLFYVGVTRARTRLALSWALSRTEGGRRTRRRSRFLTGHRPGLGDPQPARCARPLPDLRRPTAHPGAGQDRPVRQLPVQRRSGAGRRAADLAQDPVHARPRCRPSWCSPTRLLAIAERRPTMLTIGSFWWLLFSFFVACTGSESSVE